MTNAPSKSAPTVSLLDYGRLVAFGGAALLAGIACAGWLDGRREATIPGTLQAKTVTITAGRTCRLAELLVKPGQTVEAGTPLLRLTDGRLEAKLAHQQQELAALKAEVAKAEAAAEVELGWRRRELQSEAFETQMKLATLQNDRLNRRVEQIAWREHLDSTPDWTGSAAPDAFLRPITLSTAATGVDRLQAVLKEDAAALAAESFDSQIALCEQRLKELAAVEHRMQSNLRLSAGVEVAEHRLAAAEADLAALTRQQEQLTITSPGIAVVGLQLKQPGDQLSAGDAILELLDEAQRTICVRVPTPSMSGIREGLKVTVLFPDRLHREGVIAAIPPQTSGDGAVTDVPELPLQIVPCGKLWPSLAIGSRVDVVPPRS
ncbi:MAG TPA: biotin/lipoyl-binding protein [Planctomycetaceae bacterium]|nr:biotin/lipoyl-binding protein [Planctomycetaceae bacterium]